MHFSSEALRIRMARKILAAHGFAGTLAGRPGSPLSEFQVRRSERSKHSAINF